MKLACWAFALALAAVGSEPRAAAGERDGIPRAVNRFRSFGSAEGLHNLVIVGIGQDASGALWVATDDGVYRYDGERFAHFAVEDGLPSTMVTTIGVGPDGNMCAGGNLGLVCWDGARFSRAGTQGLPTIAVNTVVTAGGRLWVGAADGLYLRDERGWFSRAPGWTGTQPVKALWPERSGILAGDGGHVLVSTGDGVWRELADLTPKGGGIAGLLRDRSGALWIRTALHIWRIAASAVLPEDLSDGFPHGYDNVGVATSMANGAAGEVLVGSDVGLVVRDGDRWRLIDRAAGLPSPGARTLFVDREGTTWVGSVGLYEWRGRGLIERHDLSNGLPGDIAWSFARDRDDTLWVGTNRCLARPVDGRWTCLRGSEGRVVRSFVFPPQGGVFLGGAPSDLLYIDPAGATTSLDLGLARPPDHMVLALALGPDGDLWVATKVGLYRLAGAVPGRLEHVTVTGIPGDARYSSLLFVDGRLWSATPYGIVVLERGTWRVFDASAGFRSTSMRYLVKSHDRRLCVAYSEAIGVTCFETDGRTVRDLVNIGVAEGLNTGMVYFLGEDRKQHLWIGTGDGVDVVTAGGIEHFGETDGLAGNDSAGMAFLEDRDGSLWLGSTGGVTHVHAERYIGPAAPPRTLVRGGLLGAQPLQAERASLETTHDHNALVADYGTDSLSDTDRVEYQVRLSPLEPAWSTTHLRQARYPALPPGSYALELRARLGTRQWGPITTLRFVVHTAWWQGRWFMGLVCLAVLLMIAAGFSWRQRTVLRRRTRQLNEQSAASLRVLLEFVPDLISVHRDGKVIYLNRAARRLYGVDKTDGEIADLGERIHPDDRERLADMMQRARDADAQGVPEVVALRVRDPDGSWRICELSGARMELAGASVLVASGRDVTERHQLRAQLLVSDRMASLGTLAAGIAHEINNPLAYVIGNLQVVAEGLAGDGKRGPELATAIADAAEGAERVRRIVQGLRSFTRSEEEKLVALELPRVLDAATRMTGNEVRHRAQLVRELGATPCVLADEGRLTQVFINLIVNAAHAIPEGRSDANRIVLRTRTDEHGRAVVEIEDTGGGMPPEVQARAFDPFFTTKDVGEGTGLGLAICHSILTTIGGQIAIDSTPGRGTVVRVVLPAAPALVSPVAPSAAPATPAAPERLRVLVVDDEPMVSDMLARTLRRDHDVTKASCGRDALALVAGGSWFDAIVSDVMMPNMTGLELLDELTARAPQQARRLLFLSGGVFTPETRARLDELGTVQLEKPITAADLRRAVMSVATGGSVAPPAAAREVA